MYAGLTGSSQSSAKTDLNTLVQVGALERVGSGRQTRYRATDEWAETVNRVEDEAAASPYTSLRGRRPVAGGTPME